MSKNYVYLVILVSVSMGMGCSTKNESYEYKRYDKVYKEVQKKLAYDDVKGEKGCRLTFFDDSESLKIVFTNAKGGEHLKLLEIANPNATVYSTLKNGLQTLSYRDCTVSFDSYNEVKGTHCSSDEVARIKRDKELFHTYFKEKRINGRGLYRYCDEFVEKHRECLKT